MSEHGTSNPVGKFGVRCTWKNRHDFRMASDPQTTFRDSRPNDSRWGRPLSLVSLVPLFSFWSLVFDQIDRREGIVSTEPVIENTSMTLPEVVDESGDESYAVLGQLRSKAGSQDTNEVRKDTSLIDSAVMPAFSVHGPPDSLKQDTSHVAAVDSSARIKHFTYVRTDYPQVLLNAKRTHPFFLKNSYTRRELTIDSTGFIVTIHETLLGNDVKIPISIGMEEYIRLRLESERRAGWESIARRYQLREEQSDDLQALLGDITNIDIPVPANPLLSIFGPPKINLRISGAVDIRAAFRNSKTDQTVISRLGNVRNEPDFNQEVQILVSGTVGDKLNIKADWNTQRTFEYENQLKIKYTGYDDEIVRSVEAGNVSLPTPSGFIGSSQALFGVKSQFQMGPLTLTMLVSQKRGQVREFTISGGAREQKFVKRAYDYSTSHYFVDISYRDLFRDYYINPVPQIDLTKRITDIEVWITRLGIEVPEERDVIAYIDLSSVREGERYSEDIRNGEQQAGRVEAGRFIRLDRSQYSIHSETGYITLNVRAQNEQAIAIAFRQENDPSITTDDLFFGEFVKDDTTDQRIVMKLVKPRFLVPQYKPAWDLMLKNIYPLGGKNLKEEGFELNILYQLPGREPEDNVQNQNLLQVFGFDRYDESGGGGPDGKFDYIPGVTIDPTRGELIFPVLEPFDDGVREFFTSLGLQDVGNTLAYPAVYDTTVNGARNNTQKDRFLIQGKSSAEVTSTYNLGFNVVEGSVEAFLGDRKLASGVDYTVDYILGQVVIRNEEALLPNSNLRIKYESNDLFQLASKTLVGARGDMQLSKNTKVGFTLMNLNQETLSDKVRINEEPIQNLIMGADGSTNFTLDFLSEAIDALPILRTQGKSTVTVSGEAAYMLPDPNTKKSPIPADQGEGIAFIDDFEGAKRTIPLGTAFAIWQQSSPPGFISSLDPSIDNPIDTRVKMFSKAKTIWYNIIPSDVFITDIWPNSRRAVPGQDRVAVLNIGFDPSLRGEFNYSPDLENTLLGDPSRNWGGLMRVLSSTANNLIDENINFIEVWMKIEGDPRDGRLLIDLGQISEDAIPNDTLNSEDGLDGGFKNGSLNPAVEDVGLDMIPDSEERIRFAQFIARHPQFADDPSGDNWSFTPLSLDFTRINGSEGNAGSEVGNFPNTEDLNRNNNLDRNNSYFEYEVSLDTTGGVGGPNPLIVGGGNDGWYQFRIPLVDYVRKVGNPSLEVVEFIRIWFIGFDEVITVRIADFNLVGNQWQEEIRNDPVFSVTTVNLEDNPTYTSPPGVIRERDRTRPDQEIFSNEQSLAMVLRGLEEGQNRQAIRFYSFRPLDLFNYRTMKMFVHGDPRFFYVDTTNYDAELYIRFGLDSLNYYEYRQPVHPGWDERNNISIIFSELTAVKQGRDSANTFSERVPVREAPPGATYRVRGNPTLTRVKFVAMGVENPRNKGTAEPLFGEIWVNELRLSSVDDTPGWAYRMDASVKLADFGYVGFNVSRIDPHFHALGQRFGTRSANRSWGINTTFAVEKFFPESWKGTSIRLTYSHSEGLSQPKYVPGTDVVVDESARREEQIALDRGLSAAEAKAQSDQLRLEAETVNIQDTWAIPTMKIILPSQKWYVRDTFNRLGFGFNYNKSFARNPVTEFRSSRSWAGRMSYGLSVNHDLSVKPLGWLFGFLPGLKQYKDFKIYLAPQSFSWALSTARTQTREKVRTQLQEKPVLRNFTAKRNFAFTWKLTEGGLTNLSTDYSLDIASTLVHLETDSLGRERPFSAILGDIFFSDKFINFGIDQNYQQRVGVKSKPKIPNIVDVNKYLNITASYNVAYRWLNNIQAGDLGKNAAFQSTINVSSNFRLKQLADKIFKGREKKAPSRRRAPDRGKEKEDTEEEEKESEGEESKPEGPSALGDLGELLRKLIKIPFLDYDNISVSFNQTNNARSSGVPGKTGFTNFWGRIPFFQESDPKYGPSRLYQLGLISDPTGKLTNFGARSKFPFFGFDTERGPRAPSFAGQRTTLIDNFSQTNRLDFKTSRPLWRGARLDLSWKLKWTLNKNQTLRSDSLGIVSVITMTTTGDIERSFLSFPPVLMFESLKSNLKEVNNQFEQRLSDPSDTRSDEEKLAEAFEEGFEALPFLRSLFGEFLPRVNWSLNWDGLERLPLFKNLVSRLSLSHSYQSNFTRRFRGLPSGGETTEMERVRYGFNPLVGLNFTFEQFLKGNMSANLRYNTSTSFDLNTASRNIVEAFSREISFTMQYSRKGFSIPLFGLSMRNDVDISLTYSLTKNARKTYRVIGKNINLNGTPLDGTTRLVIEPRFRYVLSSRVTASLFYRLTKISPDAQATRIPGSKTNEAGLDIHIAIQ